MRGRLLVCALCVASSAPAFAETPSDVVKFFYENPDEVFNADNPRLADPLLAVMKSNAAHNDEPCIDFSPALAAQDWDEAELKKSLKLDEKADGDKAVVLATFKLFDNDTEVEWDLAKSGDSWKVTDIASKADEWRLSEIKCD